MKSTQTLIPITKNIPRKAIQKQSHKRSLSQVTIINSTEEKIITKKYTKMKIILKRPKKLSKEKQIYHSISPKKSFVKIITYQKKIKHDNNPIYNKKLCSERNKNNLNKNVNNITNTNNLSVFKIKKEKNIIKNDKNQDILIIIKALNNFMLKIKKNFFHKMKYNNKIYNKKTLNNYTLNNNNKTLPLFLNNKKNFLEEINLDNNIRSNNNYNTKNNEKSVSSYDDNNSNDKNITIISHAEVKKLNSSNSDNNDHNGYGNYTYDNKKIFKDIKTESNKNNKNIKRESLLFSEKNKRKNIINLKKIKIGHTPSLKSYKKNNLFIDDISFDSNNINKNLFESIGENNNINNKKINNFNKNNNVSYYLKNKNMKEYNETTNNSIEETTNINDNENNPINTIINYGDDKLIFNNSNMKNSDFDIINNKAINNYNDYNDNIIERSGELFYSVNSINSYSEKDKSSYKSCEEIDEEEEKLIFQEKNKIYLKYNIIDKSKRIINFLPKDNTINNNKIFTARIPLDSYFKIVKKINPKKNININMNKNDMVHIPQKIKFKMSFSIKAYQSFIRKLLDEIQHENNNIIINNSDKNMDDENIKIFEKKISDLKKNVLYLLVKKHYIISIDDKKKLIEENNPKIEQRKNEIYDVFMKLRKKKEYNCVLFDILKKYENISDRDIKINKSNYFKNKINENNNEKNTNNNSKFNIKAIGNLILPLFYIAKYFHTFLKV